MHHCLAHFCITSHTSFPLLAEKDTFTWNVNPSIICSKKVKALIYTHIPSFYLVTLNLLYFPFSHHHFLLSAKPKIWLSSFTILFQLLDALSWPHVFSILILPFCIWSFSSPIYSCSLRPGIALIFSYCYPQSLARCLVPGGHLVIPLTTFKSVPLSLTPRVICYLINTSWHLTRTSYTTATQGRRCNFYPRFIS